MIRLNKVEKVYRRGAETVRALRGVDLEIQAGEFAAVTGPSGAGKTTLLHILGCLDTPVSGEVLFDGARVDRMREKELTRLRREKIGFIFQQFHLIPGLSVAGNIALPLLFRKQKPDKARIEELARMVGLEQRTGHVPAALSGGEMQRTAIARALVNRPEILLADEPTGNLDSKTGAQVMEILEGLYEAGKTLIMVTHEPEIAAHARTIVHMKDGNIERIELGRS